MLKWNPAAMIDENLSTANQMIKSSFTAFYHKRNIRLIREHLHLKATEKMVHALILITTIAHYTFCQMAKYRNCNADRVQPQI